MIARARLSPFALPLRAPLATARGTLHRREGLLVRLDDAAGNSGWGEAMPLAGFGTETLAHCAEAAERLARALVSSGSGELDALAERLLVLAPNAPAARCAVEVAVLDLAARRRDAALCELLCHCAGSEARPRQRIEVNALIAANSPNATARAAQRASKAGFRTLKLKIGSASLECDIARVAAARAAVPADTAIRLDANGAFGEAEALCALERLAPHGIELVEQPVSAAEVASLARVRAASPVRIAADEAVTGVAAARALIDARAADVLVLKPPALGGPAATLAVAELAAGAGLDVVVTSLIDSSLGIAAALHCAAALPRSLACGLATAHVLERDLAVGIPVVGGEMALPGRLGLGIAPNASAAEACATGPAREISR